MSTIELLAPVGHREGLLAAVSNGADAIYVGGSAFGARKQSNTVTYMVSKFTLP